MIIVRPFIAKSEILFRLKTIIIILVFSQIFSRCSEKYPDLGNGYKIVEDRGYSAEVVNSQNTIMISEYILDYSIDSTFILVAQSPPDSLPKMKHYYFSDTDRKRIASNKNVFRRYWIINKKEKSIYTNDSANQVAKYSNVYGPYNKHQYYEQRIILNVPKKLKLENE